MRIKITLIISTVLMVARIAQSAGVRHGGPDVLAWQGPNNLQDCSKQVQKRIQDMKKGGWARMSFECRDGLVVKLNSGYTSSANDPIRFLRENSVLFGHGKIEINSDGHQYSHGIPIMSSAFGYDLKAQRIDASIYGYAFMLQGIFVDTRAWKIQPPQISSKTARGAAAKFWKSWPRPPERITVDGPFYLDVSAWQALNGGPVDKSYFLGWWVTGKDKYRSSSYAAINATNGQVISYPLRPVQ